MRVGYAAVSHETNTYADAALGTTGIDAFDRSRGEAITGWARGNRVYAGGALEAVEAAGATFVPLATAHAQPSGTIDGAAYAALRDGLLDALAGAGHLDALVLELHGAAVAEGVDDVEADLARAVRSAVGPELPVAAVLDLHGNLTPTTVEHLDAVLGVHHYPHVDMYERGARAAELALRLAATGERPAVAVERLPMLLPATNTLAGPGAGIVARSEAIERRPGVLACTFFQGFPWTDTPIVGPSAVVTAETADLATGAAAELAGSVWDGRERFRVAYPGPDEAVASAAALAGRRGPVVVNETNDNAGGGAPADGTHLLRALLAGAPRGSCFGFIVDAEAVAACTATGVGRRVELVVGGRSGPLGGEPLELAGWVRCLTDGHLRLRSAMGRGARIELGPTARLTVGGIDVLVASRRQQTFDPGVFALHGIDVAERPVVALKSQNHFRAGFEGLAAAVVTSDAPGVTTADVASLPRRRPPGPVWPLDGAARYP